MFFQSRAFPTKKTPDFVWLFLISKKAKGVQKSKNFKIWLQKSQLATWQNYIAPHSQKNAVRSKSGSG